MKYSFFDESQESIVGYYVLPLIGLSIKMFGCYFKSAHISRDHLTVLVKMSRGCKEPFWDHRCYQNDWDEGPNTYAIFRLPNNVQSDIKHFAEGKYSKISQSGKLRIYRNSGLHHNKQIDNLVVTDMKLLALTKSNLLREWIRSNYGITKGKNNELLELSDKESIYYD